MYSFVLFALFGFYLFMFNNYHLIFVNKSWCIELFLYIFHVFESSSFGLFNCVHSLFCFTQVYLYINRNTDICSDLEKVGSECESHKTRRVRNTDRKRGREESIHTRHRLIETDKQTRNVREGDRGYYIAKINRN